MHIISGGLSNLHHSITGEIVGVKSIDGELTKISSIAGDLATGVTVYKDIEIYEGSYEVQPLPDSDIVLNTAGKGMTDNLVILEIPYYETTNLSGGYTVM